MRDQSWHFAYKLYQAGVDVYLYSFDHCVHGMLNVAVETNVSAKIWHTVLLSCITIFTMEKEKDEMPEVPEKIDEKKDQENVPGIPNQNPAGTILDQP